MSTLIEVSVIYASESVNDINKFDFQMKMLSGSDRNTIKITAVPEFSLDGQKVKHIMLSMEVQKRLSDSEVLHVISQLVELKDIVSDLNLNTTDATNRLQDAIQERLRLLDLLK